MIEIRTQIEDSNATLTIRKHRGQNSLMVQIEGFMASLAELEVLSLTKQGYTMSSVANSMGISENTVKNRLWAVRSRNSSKADVDYHNQGINLKAGELLWPVYVEGLKVMRDSYCGKSY